MDTQNNKKTLYHLLPTKPKSADGDLSQISSSPQPKSSPRRKKSAMYNSANRPSFWWIVGIFGALLLGLGILVLVGVIISVSDPNLYKALMAKVPEQLVIQPYPDLKLPEAVPPSDEEKATGADSLCPPGALTISFRGPVRVGSKDWFAALPPEGETMTPICVQTKDYKSFLEASGTFNGVGFLSGKHLSGLEILAYSYSVASTGDDSRFEELKNALNTLTPATLGGKPVETIGWVKLPGYKKPANAPTLPKKPLCGSGNCFDPIPPTSTPMPSPTLTPFQPMKFTATPQPTSMFTPTPAYVDAVLVPTLVPVTKQPAVATAMQNVTADEWLLINEYAREYNGTHCQHIYTVDMYTMASSELWAYTTKVTFKNGQLGWMVEGDRHDVFVPGFGEYPVYAVCGQVINMPDSNNLDGNGTSWNGGIGVYYPPADPDPATGLIHIGETYYVNVNGVWLAPAYPKPAPFAPTATATPTHTPYPNQGTLTVDQAINYSNNGLFDMWIAVSGTYPSAANPKIEMESMGVGRFWIDFTGYVDHINKSGATLQLTGCAYPVAQNNGGYKIATNDSQGDWCITPGK